MNFVGILINFLHLLTTVIWIGGVAFRSLVFGPIMKKYKADSISTTFIIDVAKRFNKFVWACIAILLITGIPLTVGNPMNPGSINLSNPWSSAIFIKHMIYGLMIIIVGLQTINVRRMDKAMKSSKIQSTKGQNAPSKKTPEIFRAMRRQNINSNIILILGILTLILTVMAEKAFVG